MDFNTIEKRLNALVESGKKGELRGALSMLNEVDIAEYLATLDNERVIMVFRLLPRAMSSALSFWTSIGSPLLFRDPSYFPKRHMSIGILLPRTLANSSPLTPAIRTVPKKSTPSSVQL